MDYTCDCLCLHLRGVFDQGLGLAERVGQTEVGVWGGKLAGFMINSYAMVVIDRISGNWKTVVS